MKNKLAPSLMCCDFLNLERQIRDFEQCGVELLHFDIMDGSFVPNFALGSDFVHQVKEATNIKLDVHLMTEYPERHIDLFPVGEGDYVSVHLETTKHLQRVLQAIRKKGAHTLLAINPATPVEMAQDVLDDIDGILIMSVNPGFAGQKMIEHSIEKIRRTRKFLDSNEKYDLEIEVDGNVSLENGIKMAGAGANIFVLGSSVLEKGESNAASLEKFRNAVSNFRIIEENVI